jgi:hypothetical protein
MPTYKRADLGRLLPAVKCTARKRNGEPCRAMAARGATVCRVHGGSAPQVKAAAKRRLEQALDAAAQRLLGFAFDEDVRDVIALAAVNGILDRGGLTAKQALEIGVDPAPWEEVLSNLAGIARISREESRARRGLPAPETPELPPAMEIVDAELVDPAQKPDITAANSPADSRTAPAASDAPADTPANVSGPMKGLVSFEEAVTETQTRTRVTRVKRLR